MGWAVGAPGCLGGRSLLQLPSWLLLVAVSGRPVLALYVHLQANNAPSAVVKRQFEKKLKAAKVRASGNVGKFDAVN